MVKHEELTKERDENMRFIVGQKRDFSPINHGNGCL